MTIATDRREVFFDFIGNSIIVGFKLESRLLIVSSHMTVELGPSKAIAMLHRGYRIYLFINTIVSS